jgi:hypothetical protein
LTNSPTWRKNIMATMERVAELMHARISKNSPKQLEKADGLWPELPMNFFYLTHAEDTVDIVVTSIMKKVADEDSISISDEVVENLQNLVSPKTLVKDAIRLIFLTAFQPPSDN